MAKKIRKKLSEYNLFNKFNIIRIPMPIKKLYGNSSFLTYVNSLQLNNKVIIPNYFNFTDFNNNNNDNINNINNENYFEYLRFNKAKQIWQSIYDKNNVYICRGCDEIIIDSGVLRCAMITSQYSLKYFT